MIQIYFLQVRLPFLTSLMVRTVCLSWSYLFDYFWSEQRTILNLKFVSQNKFCEITIKT